MTCFSCHNRLLLLLWLKFPSKVAAHVQRSLFSCERSLSLFSHQEKRWLTRCVGTLCLFTGLEMLCCATDTCISLELNEIPLLVHVSREQTCGYQACVSFAFRALTWITWNRNNGMNSNLRCLKVSLISSLDRKEMRWLEDGVYSVKLRLMSGHSSMSCKSKHVVAEPGKQFRDWSEQHLNRCCEEFELLWVLLQNDALFPWNKWMNRTNVCCNFEDRLLFVLSCTFRTLYICPLISRELKGWLTVYLSFWNPWNACQRFAMLLLSSVSVLCLFHTKKLESGCDSERKFVLCGW